MIFLHQNNKDYFFLLIFLDTVADTTDAMQSAQDGSMEAVQAEIQDETNGDNSSIITDNVQYDNDPSLANSALNVGKSKNIEMTFL